MVEPSISLFFAFLQSASAQMQILAQKHIIYISAKDIFYSSSQDRAFQSKQKLGSTDKQVIFIYYSQRNPEPGDIHSCTTNFHAMLESVSQIFENILDIQLRFTRECANTDLQFSFEEYQVFAFILKLVEVK
jgi:hypothetical protein